MKKICCLLLFASMLTVLFCACNPKQQASSIIKSQRRFAKYIEPQQNNKGGRIDLSEGPKLRYDANFGPSTPNFDFKIINPY